MGEELSDLGYYKCPEDGCGYEESADTVADVLFNHKVFLHQMDHTAERQRRERYFIKPSVIEDDGYTEVTKDQFITAEHQAGFRSKGGPGTVATGGFSGGGISGRIRAEYSWDGETWHSASPYS